MRLLRSLLLPMGIACLLACGNGNSGGESSVSTCGDGKVEGSEQCDDWGTIPGDGCSATCQYEVGACDDGLFCTTGETWAAGVCGGGRSTDCSGSADACHAGVCDESTDRCEVIPANVGGACGDGRTECSGQDTCDAAGNCLSNDFADTTPCGDAGSACVNQDLCDGAGACRDGGFAQEGESCGASLGLCMVADICDGAGSCQPAPDPTPLDLDLDFPQNQDYRWPAMPIPEDNPTTLEGVALGRRLFFDPMLSSDDTISCASCHDPAFAFSGKGEQFNTGADGVVGTFNAPALINLGWTSGDPYRLSFESEHFAIFWNGRARSLEEQARSPVESSSEMNLPWEEAEAKLQADPVYPMMFGAAFGDTCVTQDRIVFAIAQFERTLRSYDSKWDRLMRGELADGEFTPLEFEGFFAFNTEVGDCFHCHGQNMALFANNSSSGLFNNNGLDSSPDPGLMEITGAEQHEGRFRVPTLRNIEFTAPYMHDGRFETLDDVIQHYSEGVATDSPNLDSALRARALTGPMSPRTVAALKAFLLTLSDPDFLTNPDFQDPFSE